MRSDIGCTEVGRVLGQGELDLIGIIFFGIFGFGNDEMVLTFVNGVFWVFVWSSYFCMTLCFGR